MHACMHECIQLHVPRQRTWASASHHIKSHHITSHHTQSLLEDKTDMPEPDYNLYLYIYIRFSTVLSLGARVGEGGNLSK